MAESTKPTNPFAPLAGIAGAAGGWAFSHYVGPSLWVPLGATLVLLLLFTKTPLRPKYFGGAIATTGGHVAWFVVASLMMHNWIATGLDIVILTAGIIWLWAGPGLAAALFLGFVQLASLVFNVYQLSQQPIGSGEHKGLTVHCVWRTIALLCLFIGYRKLRRDRIAATTPPPLPEPL